MQPLFKLLLLATLNEALKANFYFCKNSNGETLWVSDFNANEDCLTEEIKALGNIFIHMGGITEHSEYIAYMQMAKDPNELKQFVFIISPVVMPDAYQSLCEGKDVFVYSKNSPQAREAAQKYVESVLGE